MSSKTRNLVRGGILIAALILIAAGIVSHDVDAVFHRAVRICFECIGLG